MAHIFISYSKQDIDFVRYLRALLEKEGFAVWMDEARLHPGDEWWEAIEQNVQRCAAFIIVMSPQGKDSKWVQREILLAENNHKPVFPVLLSGGVWSRLADIQYEDCRAGLHAKLSPAFIKSLRAVCEPAQPVPKKARTIAFTVEQGNIIETAADVIVLKYAQAFHGADLLVAQRIVTRIPGELNSGLMFEDLAEFAPDSEVGKFLNTIKLPEGQFGLVDTQGATAAPKAMYIGMPRLRHTGYDHLRQFGKWSLEFLTETAPDTRHIAMTIHGPGFGLDETEALLSQFAGFIDAIEAGTFPPALEQITVVEYVPARVQRLRKALEPHLGEAHYAEINPDNTDLRWGYRLRLPALQGETQPEAPEAITSAGVKPKNTVFAIVPAEMEDLFYYGIQAPVHAQGLLCERIEMHELTDEVVNQIKERIESAALVIAEMTQPTPYVYLQLGYAWGKNCPTVLISSRDMPSLNGYLHVRYDKIRDLEAGLGQALELARTEGWV